MFDKSSGTLGVTQIAVEVTLSDQTTFCAEIYAKVGIRLQDVLNDERSFIPLLRQDGSVMMAAKSSLFSVTEIDAKKQNDQTDSDQQQTTKQFDPYAVLRIEKTAPISDIKRAYKERIKSVHPDTIAALDLDEDLARTAVRIAQRVNRAYKLIMDQHAQTQSAQQGAA